MAQHWELLSQCRAQWTGSQPAKNRDNGDNGDGIADKRTIVRWLFEEVQSRARGEVRRGWSCTWQGSRKLSNQSRVSMLDTQWSRGLLQHRGINIRSLSQHLSTQRTSKHGAILLKTTISIQSSCVTECRSNRCSDCAVVKVQARGTAWCLRWWGTQ